MRLRSLTALAAIAALATPALAAPDAISGRWTTDDKRAVVKVGKCGSTLCGTIERFLVAEPEGGLRDSKNPKASLRNRHVEGLRILWSLSPDGSEWKGEGYSPRDGRYFNATVRRNGPNLEVEGCVLLFCRTVTWTPA